MEYFDSIENLPLYNFEQINSTNDFSFLFINRKEGMKFDEVKMQKIWAKIYDEFLSEFGVSESLIMFIERMNRVLEYYNLAYNEGQRHYLTLAEIEKRKAYDSLESGSNGISTIAYVSKFMGFRINPKEIPVKEFYNYLKLATNGQEN